MIKKIKNVMHHPNYYDYYSVYFRQKDPYKNKEIGLHTTKQRNETSEHMKNSI
jgi:hypothetical protein